MFGYNFSVFDRIKKNLEVDKIALRHLYLDINVFISEFVEILSMQEACRNAKHKSESIYARGGGGGYPREFLVGVCLLVLQILRPYFRPKNVIFHSRFQTWPLRKYVIITYTRNTCIAEPRKVQGDAHKMSGMEWEGIGVNCITVKGFNAGSIIGRWDASALALKRIFWDLNGVAVVKAG